MRKLKLFLSMLMLIAFSVGNVWAEVVSETTYGVKSATTVPDGWSVTDSYSTGGGGYAKLTYSENSILTDDFCQNGFTSIVVKARKFGSPSDTQAKITVEWCVSGNDDVVLGTVAPSSTTLTNYTISSPASVTANQSGKIRISCKGASNDKGSGVSEVTINYTVGSCTAAEPHTVSFSTGDGNSAVSPITETSGGAGITLPEGPTPACSADGWSFAGWAAAAVGAETTTAPTLLSGTYHPTENCTLFAVYKRTESGDVEELNVTETFENQTAGSTYNNTTPAEYASANSNASLGWAMYYGTVSTNDKITGSNSAHMRWYSSAKTTYGYIQTTTPISGLQKISFNARVSNTAVKMSVWYSTDGANWTLKEENLSFTSQNTSTPFSSTINGEVGTNYYIKIGVGDGGTAPSSGNYKLIVDDVKFEYKAGSSTTYYLSAPSCCEKHAITIAAGIENGSVSADPASACENATITLTFTPDLNYHLSAWTLNGAAQDIAENTFEMPNEAVIVSATFAPDACTPLNTPSVAVSGKAYPYNAVKLAWSAIDNADAYKVYIYDAEDNELEHNDAVTGVEYTIGQTLSASTTYKYSVQAISNTPATYCPSVAATGSFVTDALPKAHLTLIALGDEHEDTGDYSILTPFNLPSTAASCAKTFMGWDADPDCATIPTYAKGAEFTFDNTTGVTLYAVYADETPGEATIKTDELDYEFTGLAGTSYKEWSGKTGTSGAVYAGQSCALGSNPQSTYIQLRTNNSNSGVVTTTTGAGKVTKVTVTWNAAQGNDGIKLDVYGKNTAYSQATDLYGDNAGTLLGSIVKGTSTELAITGSYDYIGLRSNSGTVYLDEIDVQWTAQGASTFSNYSTTCVAAPTAEPASASIAVAAAGGEGTLGVSYENVNLAGVTAALYNNEACTEAFDGGWLTATIEGDDKHIAYTIAENTAYAARTAYIKLTAPETNGAANPAVVVIPVEQAKKPAVFASLEDLVAAKLASGTEVTVSFSNVMITEVYKTNAGYRYGLYLNVKDKDGENDIELFYNKQGDSEQVPDTWVKNGYVSATNLVGTWTLFSGTWELAMQGATWSWENGDITYGAPKAVTSVVVSGEPTKKAYVDGEKFNPAGLTVTVNYNIGEPDVIDAAGADWVYETSDVMALNQTSIKVKATYNTVTSENFYEVTDLTVNPITNKTIAQFIADEGGRCYLEGIVSGNINTTYGNFDLQDETGTIYVYGSDVFEDHGVALGDKVKVIAEEYLLYKKAGNPDKDEALNVEFVSKKSPVDITITSGSTVEKGKTLTLTATTDPAAAIDHISYSVKVDGNEGNVSLSDNVLTGVEVGEATIIASIPDGEGYIANSVEFTVEVTQAIVHASITYVENGANEDIADVDDATELPDPLPTVTKDNFLFGGWYTDAEFNTPAVAGAALSEDVTLYAKWNAIPPFALVYTSNVAFTGQNSYESGGSKVVIAEEQYDAQKVGASGNQGQVLVTVPAMTHTLHFHAFTWKNKSNVISISGVTNPSATTFDVIGDNGGGASSPYTIEGNPIDHYYSVTFDAVAEETVITFDFSSGGDKRFIMYGINQEGGVYPVLDHIVITGNASTTEYEAGDEFDPAGLGVNAIYTLADVEQDPVAVDASDIEWSFAPAVLTAETESVTVTATYEGKQANKVVNVNVTVPTTPEILATPDAINFGTVNQNAEVDAQGISVTLKAVAAATVTLAGDGAAAFSIDKAALSELNSTVTVTPVTTATGTFAATVTISDDADAADDVVINLSMTVEAVEDLSGTWVKATSVAAGDRIIIGATVAAGTKTMGGQNTNNRAAVASTYEDLVLTPTEGTKTLLVVDAGDGKFALQALNGKYLTSATSGTGNNLLEAANYENDNAKWTITIDGEGVASVVAAAGSRTYMKYNNGSTLFSCYQYETSQSPINIYKKGTPDYGSYQRNGLTAGDYGTICLPKAGTIEGATLFEIGSYENEMIYVDEVIGGVMEAGKPYIFQATADQLNVTYTSGAQVAAGEANGLHGFYNLENMATDAADKLDLDEDQGNYILYQNAYWLVSGRAAYINNFRAYIKIGEIQNTPAPEPTPGQAPRRRVAMSVHGEQVATGMENVQGDNVQCTKVLIDGQLFILRGEKMYDVKGQLVK